MAIPSRVTRGALLLLLAIAARPAPAQAIAGVHQLSLGMGLLHGTERDASASPLLYGGTGASYAGEYTRDRGRSRTELRADATSHGIASTRGTSIPARGEVLRLEGAVSHLRTIRGTGSGRWRVLAGGALLGSATDRTEELVNGESRLYRSYIVSLAPTVRVELSLGGDGALGYEVAVPLLSGITHPWSDVHLLDDPAARQLHWRGPGSYRQLEQRVSFTRAIASRVGWRTTLLTDLYADADAPQRAGARHVLSMALVLWTRRPAPEAAQ